MRWLIFALLLAGCGQGVPATTSPVADPTEAEVLANWTPANQALYAIGKKAVQKHLLDFPADPNTEWLAPRLATVNDPATGIPKTMAVGRVKAILPSGASPVMEWTCWHFDATNFDGSGYHVMIDGKPSIKIYDKP
jgi:hypothetical protein